MKERLILKPPVVRWDEAIPLGNGLIGVLVWGEKNKINLSIDRGDLWDNRSPEVFKAENWNWETLKQLVRNNDMLKVRELFENPYEEFPYPTKIPAGRIEITLDENIEISEFSLDFNRALAQVHFDAGELEIFVSVEEPVVIARISGSAARLKILSPFHRTGIDEPEDICLSASPELLGYPPPIFDEDRDCSWAIQECEQGFRYVMITSTRQDKYEAQYAFTVTSTNDSPNPLLFGQELLAKVLDTGFEKKFVSHKKWWEKYWNISQICIPDARIQQHYYLSQYFYGASSRKGCPPIALQGVWTADEGTLPPWKGDYHHDLNTELTYSAYLTAGHMQEGLCFLDWLWELLPSFCSYAREFMGTGGACIPSTMSFEGNPIGGWAQYSFSPTNGAWVAHAFFVHWRYTMDEEFLRQRAYPFCRKIGESLLEILEPNNDGKLVLPLSSSPEIHSNSLDAWLKPNSNYDLSLLKVIFHDLYDMAHVLKLDEAEDWEAVLGKFENAAIAEVEGNSVLLIAPGERLKESHRHHSHLMAIYPLGQIHIEGTDEDMNLIKGSLNDIDSLGMHNWVGYSFAWMACMSARCGMADRALNMLELYLKGFVSRNGFHLNGDFKNLGLSAYKYRPFTLEGNFAAAQAVHEMLLQSWGGTIRIFPAVPCVWKDLSFSNLRAEGGYVVSAEMKNDETVYVKVKANCDGELRIRKPYNAMSWNKNPIACDASDVIFYLKKGEMIEGLV